MPTNSKSKPLLRQETQGFETTRQKYCHWDKRITMLWVVLFDICCPQIFLSKNLIKGLEKDQKSKQLSK